MNRARAGKAAADIGAHERLKQELVQLRRQLAHMGRVSMMGELASTLAHELSQPLAAILRNAEAASLFLSQPSPDLIEVGAILDDIRSDDLRAGAVIERVRTLLRRQEVSMGELHVAQVLEDVASLVRAEAAARHVALKLAFSTVLPPAHGDRMQIQQVLLNLVLNAMDALDGPKDGARSVVVTARLIHAPARVEISVSDNGSGIDADKLERVFDPFFTTKAQGMGMGLSISRNIIDAHGGRIWAESSSTGATLRFTLRLAEQAVAGAPR